MKKPRVYLAGPIRGLNYGAAVDWRQWVKAALADHGIDGMSLMRAKDYLRGLTDVGAGQVLADQFPEFPLSTMQAIVTRDRLDCMKSDMVLVNFLGAKVISIGTVLEVAWADAARVPVVLVSEKTGNVHEHGMIRQMCGFHVETLEEAIHVCRAVLLP